MADARLPIASADGASPAPVDARLPEALAALVDQVHVGICLVRDGRFVFANACLAAMLGYEAGQLRAEVAVLDIVHTRDHALVDYRRRRPVPGALSKPYALRLVRRDGHVFPVQVQGRRIEFDGGAVDLVTVIDRSQSDCTLRLADWRARTLSQAEALSGSGSAEVDLRRGRFTASLGLAALLGLPARQETLPRKQALARVAPQDRAAVDAAWRQARPGQPFEIQHGLLRADGECRVVLQRGLVDSDHGGRPAHGVAVLQDVTAQRGAVRRLHELANYNALSGLPNRMVLLERVRAGLELAGQRKTVLTLLAIAVPQIDQVRGTLGYAASDALLAAVVSRLARTIAKGDLLVDLGNGEFALLLAPERGGDPNIVSDVARLIDGALEAPESCAMSEIVLSHEIGVALSTTDGVTPDQLLESARSALRDKPEPGGSRVRFFSPRTSQPAIRRLALEAALRHALARGEFELVYQPQVNLRTGGMVAVEALLRWHSAELGDVAPAEFIPVAERTGQIIDIGAWVLAQACAQSRTWRQMSLDGLRINVNVSTAQIRQPDFVQRIQAMFVDTGCNAQSLGIEVTESVLAGDLSTAARNLHALRALGVEIALDDFGTGCANLSMLRALPIDVIKIDRSYVHDIAAPPAEVSMTRAVITMAHGLQMRVLAEGVETQGQLALLVANHCDAMQGYFYSPPVPAAQIERLWRERCSLAPQHMAPAARQRTLLLVDDEENIIASLKRLLRRSGYRIVTALSAAEGLQRLAETEVDVIVSDQRMPGMTGVEFLRCAKSLYPDTVRIVLSGYTELQSITDAINEGAIYKFLTKPWEDDLLRANIDEAFRQKELADDNRRLDHEVRVANLELAELNRRLERALVSQRGQVSLAQEQGSSAREALFGVPVPMFGLDDEDMLAFVNAECARLLPALPGMLGCHAEDALPPELREALAPSPALGGSDLVCLSGHWFRCISGVMQGHPRPRGRLIALSPQSLTEPAWAPLAVS